MSTCLLGSATVTLLRALNCGFDTIISQGGFEPQRPRNFAAPRAPAEGAAFWRPAPRAPPRPCQPWLRAIESLRWRGRLPLQASGNTGQQNHWLVLRLALRPTHGAPLSPGEPLRSCPTRSCYPTLTDLLKDEAGPGRSMPRCHPGPGWRLSGSPASPWAHQAAQRKHDGVRVRAAKQAAAARPSPDPAGESAAVPTRLQTVHSHADSAASSCPTPPPCGPAQGVSAPRWCEPLPRPSCSAATHDRHCPACPPSPGAPSPQDRGAAGQ